MDKEIMAIRITAVNVAVDLVKSMPPTLVLARSFSAESLLKDAEAIEKYILRYETKPKQE